MKLAIVVDSSSGLTEKQAKERGWHYLPLYLTIDGKEYRDGIDLTVDTFLDVYKKDSKTHTSCTPIGQSLALIEKLSKENDFVVVYPISMEISSQYNNLEVIARQYKNVFVVKSKLVCQFIVRDLMELEKDVKENKLTVRQAIDVIENRDYSEVNVLLYPKDINVLVRGGRLAPSAAKLAKLLKIFPVIGLENGKLEKFHKGVTFNKTFINTVVDQYKKVTKKLDKQILLLDTENEDADKLLQEALNEIEYSKKIIRSKIPPVISIHTGYGAIAVFFMKLREDVDFYKF